MSVLTLDHQEFEIIGTLDFVSAMFFFCKTSTTLFDDQTRAFD